EDGFMPVSGHVPTPGDEDWMRFTLDAEKQVVITPRPPGGNTNSWLFPPVNSSSHGWTLYSLYSDPGDADPIDGPFTSSKTHTLAAGTYWVRVYLHGNDNDGIASWRF